VCQSRKLDHNPQARRQRPETVEHPFGTITMRMSATHLPMRLANVAWRRARRIAPT